MTAEAIAIAMRAYENAIRLGHPYLGGEHFLLALAAAGQPAGAVLREHGSTPGRVEAEMVRLAGGRHRGAARSRARSAAAPRAT